TLRRRLIGLARKILDKNHFRIEQCCKFTTRYTFGRRRRCARKRSKPDSALSTRHTHASGDLASPAPASTALPTERNSRNERSTLTTRAKTTCWRPSSFITTIWRISG